MHCIERWIVYFIERRHVDKISDMKEETYPASVESAPPFPPPRPPWAFAPS